MSKTDPMWVFENYGAAAELIDEIECELAALKAQPSGVDERAAFREHLARCAAEVATWPEWKRNCMGQVLLPDQEISEIDKHRIELLPEYGAGYVARAYGEEAEPIAEASGFTAAEAIKLVVAALAAPTAKKEG